MAKEEVVACLLVVCCHWELLGWFFIFVATWCVRKLCVAVAGNEIYTILLQEKKMKYNK